MAKIQKAQKRVLPSVVKQQGAGAVAAITSDLIMNYRENRINQEQAQINNDLVDANIKMLEVTNEHRLKYQSDPYSEKGINELESAYNKIFSNYKKDFAFENRSVWNQGIKKLKDQYKIDNQSWSIMQGQANAATDLQETVQKNLNLAYQSGKSNDLMKGLSDFSDSYQRLQQYGKNTLGEETTNKALKEYESDYMKMFLSGSADENPALALNLMDDDKVKNSFSDINDWSKMKTSFEERLFNIGKINQKKVIINELKNNSSLLNRTVTGEMLSYNEVLGATEGKPEYVRDFFLTANGYKKQGDVKMTKAEKLAEGNKVIQDIIKLVSSGEFKQKDIDDVQKKLFTAVNNESITRSEADDLMRGYMVPYANSLDESMKKFDERFWVAEDVGYSQVQSYVKDLSVSVPEDDMTDSEKLYNAQLEATMYKNYDLALRKEANRMNITIDQINSLDRLDRASLYRRSFARAKHAYVSENFPQAVDNDGNVPNNIITSDGRKINVGLDSTKPTASVTTNINKATLNITFDSIDSMTEEELDRFLNNGL